MSARVFWSDEQLARLRDSYPNKPTAQIADSLGRTVRSVYRKARDLGLQKSADYLASPLAGRLRPGSKIGGATRFGKGHQTWNAGMKGWTAPGTEQTQFAKGSKPHNTKPIGSERISKDGYLQRKVTETGYPPRDWIGVHILMWQEANGPLPEGHAVVFKDGNKGRIVLDNLECVSRADLMARNTIHRYPRELKDVIRLKAKLTRKIHEHD